MFNKIGDASLSVAAFYGRIEVVKLLSGLQDSQIDKRNKAKGTPLLQAASNGHDDVVRVLLENGADIHATSVTGDTALTLAIKAGSLAIVQMLIKHDTNVTKVRNNDDEAPLHIATKFGHYELSSIC